jgi:response regulator RpfG family c-di-GMP phosphodiesterase
MERILIIDDNQDIRENFAELLHLNSYDVLTAGNGKDGIRLAREIIPDLILCDIHMPSTDGFEVFEILKTSSETKFIPFIFLTAIENTPYRCRSFDVGADDFISKTTGETELLSIIRCRIKKNRLVTESLTAEKQQYISELRSLLQNISHSVRSPLCSNLGLINLLELKDRLSYSDEELEMIIEGIKNSTLRLDDCTKDLTEQLNALVERTNRTIQPGSRYDKDHDAA